MGAKKSPQALMMISEWREHGTITDFIIAYPETNRLKLVTILPRTSSERPLTLLLRLTDVGLKYLHDWLSVHADLKSESQASNHLT